MTTDLDQAMREAIVTLLEADHTLRSLCGRTKDFVIELEGFSATYTLPIIAFEVGVVDEATGRIDATFTGCAEGDDAGRIARALCARIPNVLTWGAFASKNLDLVPGAPIRQSTSSDELVQFLKSTRTGSPFYQLSVCAIPLQNARWPEPQE